MAAVGTEGDVQNWVGLTLCVAGLAVRCAMGVLSMVLSVTGMQGVVYGAVCWCADGTALGAVVSMHL